MNQIKIGKFIAERRAKNKCGSDTVGVLRSEIGNFARFKNAKERQTQHQNIPVRNVILGHMKNGGSIINISSVGGSVPDISQIAYGTSKAAINYLTKLIAVHEAKHKIRCNAVLPGMTATDAVKENLSDDFRALFLKHIPLSRMGLPEEIASAVLYFASDDSAYTTGQILSVSGGFGLATPVYGDLKDRLDRR